MKPLNGVTEMLQFIDHCLQTADWDQLGQLQATDLSADNFANRAQLQSALDDIERMQARLEQEMHATAQQLEDIPAFRKAAKTYLGN